MTFRSCFFAEAAAGATASALNATMSAATVRRGQVDGMRASLAARLSGRRESRRTLKDRAGRPMQRHDVLEITENTIMLDPARTLDVLGELAGLGVGLSLDDFGTGYSCLAYLKRLPVDELKIDRSFVFEMGTDPADAAIVQTAVDLGRRLGISVAAEGVEDAGTLRRLTEYGAMTAQGFHIARPMPAHD